MPTKIFHVAVASGILPLANIYIYTEKERETERETEREGIPRELPNHKLHIRKFVF